MVTSVGVAAATAALTVGVSPVPASAQPVPADPSTAAGAVTERGERGSATFRRTVVTLTNKARARHDRRRLDVKPCLDRVAQRWARHMARTGDLEHNDLDAVQRACGRRFGVGENIAYGYGTPRAVVRGWMSSDGHRRNILRRSYDHIGVGAFRKDGTWWWVQDFGDMRG